MRVVVNQLATLSRKTGIGHYTGQLLRCLRDLAPIDRIASFPAGWFRAVRRLGSRVRPYLDPGVSDWDGEGSLARYALSGLRSKMLRQFRHWDRAVVGRRFRAACKRKSFDLYHEPNFIPLACELPTVVTLHDLSVLLHPEWHPADRVAYFERHFHRGLNSCEHFLTISEFSRQEVIRTLNLAPEKVTRTYMGIRPGLRPVPTQEVNRVLRRLGLPSRYLLYLGTIEPRKNVLHLMEVYCSLPAALRERWPLLLVGSWGWNTGKVAEYLHDEARHRGVIHLGYVAEENVAAIYNGARALLYPTWYEGFGLPPLEMMACGGAVLASTAGALVETIGGSAHLLAPGDKDAWRTSIRRVVEDDEWWQSLRRGVRGVARPFTWERCAQDTLAVYRAVTGAEKILVDRVAVEVPQNCRIAG